MHVQYGFGIFNTGVEVHTNEWTCGNQQYNLPGIFRVKKPGNLKSFSDIDGVYTFFKTLSMNTTSRTLPETLCQLILIDLFLGAFSDIFEIPGLEYFVIFHWNEARKSGTSFCLHF